MAITPVMKAKTAIIPAMRETVETAVPAMEMVVQAETAVPVTEIVVTVETAVPAVEIAVTVETAAPMAVPVTVMPAAVLMHPVQ